MSGSIVFDGSVLAAGPITGVGRSLCTTLMAYAPMSTAPVRLLLPHGAEDPGINGVDIVAVRAGPVARHLDWPRLLRRLDARVFHSPVAALPWRSPCPSVATVHDLPWHAPEPLVEPGTGWRHRIALRIAARRATAIITPSTSTRDDLARELGSRLRAPIVVVPHGIPAPRSPTEAANATGPFLVLGDDRPRKNLARVRRAYEIGRRMYANLPSLKLVGPGFGYVSEQEKEQLLRHSNALLHLSLFEGFGLPVVEAFAHGTPVVCSNRASLPEVAGDAALTVDPTDVEAMAHAMVRIHTDEALRTRLRARGLRRAARFTPASSAAAWLRLHAEISA